MNEMDLTDQSLKMASQDAIFFEKRKQDHIRLAMDARTQSTGLSGFDKIQLEHCALPEINFSDINLETELLGLNVGAPFYISSMTAGHAEGEKINLRLARLSAEKNILMGVGSQRKELSDSSAGLEWKKIRSSAPKAKLIGNLGIAQVIHTEVGEIERLIESLEAVGLFIHLNPLQEVLQPEGTPQFKGSLTKIEELTKKLSVPLIIKEVGCGISESTAKKLIDVGVRLIDVAGMGGTHWGRIEGFRATETSPQAVAAEAFKNWGISTTQSVLNVKAVAQKETSIWASGGVRSGLDAAKLIALGAEAVGIAQPFLRGALDSDLALNQVFSQFEYELKIALFCLNQENLRSFKHLSQSQKVWSWT
jgi:isopentenyl-diphosphate delta-isomerase